MKVLRWSCVLVSSYFFTFAFSATASPVGLIPANAAWRYLSDGTDPGAAWNTPGFDDSAWPVGPAQLGYGEGDETTVVNTPLQRPVTVYFRRGVLIPSGTDLILRLLRDDGAVVYFNGVEVRRDNLPAGPINSQTLAIAAVGGTDETTFFETVIPASAVVPGTNVIAVEVHQNSVTSSDLSFALELIANFESPGPRVTVVTLDSEAREIPPWLDIPEDPAVFQVRRTGGTSNSLTVSVQLSGTASNGVDYELIPGTVTIPAGSATANVAVHAIDDSLAEGAESVLLSLVPTPCPECYVIDFPSAAGAFIRDDEGTNSPPTVWISQPQSGAAFAAPADIFFRAVASDREDGYDIAVEFFEGTNKIGNATFIPSLCPAPDCPSWDLVWSNVPPGNYVLTAKATDKIGLMTVSAPVHISVISTNPPPTNSIVLRFEPPSLPGGSRLISNWVENGFYFSTPNRMGHTDNGVSGAIPSNGTAYLQFGSNHDPLTIVNLNGRPFSLLSLDLAEYSIFVSTQRIISIGGTRADGTAVSTLVQLDGIIDGSGPQPDFQTFNLGPLFSGLTRVEISPNPYSLDNVRVAIDGTNPPPERTVINVVATSPQTREPGLTTDPIIAPGAFTFYRTSNLDSEITVFFSLGGSASNGVDYVRVTNQVVIPAHATQAVVNVFPRFDNVSEGTETVVLTLEHPACFAVFPPLPQCYIVGTLNQATVFITDWPGTNQPPEQTVISVVTTDSQASEPAALGTNSSPINLGRFAIRRTGNLTSSIPVFFSLGGTAANGTDYAFISNRVVIPAGSTQALVTVTPLIDNLVEGMETVVLTIEPVFCPAIFPPPPECYVIGSPTQATVFIADFTSPTNQPPFVQINQPQEGEVFTAPANIQLQAYAQDPEDGYGYNTGTNGSRLTVEFFESTNRIGVGTFVATTCPAPYCPFFTFTWSNVPPGNYTLRAKVMDSTGAMTMSAPVHISVVPGGSNTNRVLVSMGSVWKYHDQCAELGTEWRNVLYDDSTWPQGPAQLGYGDNDETTIISPGPDPNLRCITAYFRRVFGVTNIAGVSQLRGRLLQDDGGAVYLNGVEIFRSNLPAGEISRNTLATVSVENQIVEFTAPANLLVNGPNVIAVEMHQASLSSGDLSFDLELHAEVSLPTNLPPQVVIVTPHDGDSFPAGSSIFLGANVFTHNAGVQRVDFYRGSNFIGQAIGPLPGPSGGWGLSWSNPPIGSHVLRAVATDTVGLRGTSAPVNITVFGPDNTNALPLVRVFASDQNASEGPSTNGAVNTGRFTFTRTGGISNSLGVFFVLSGTASNGVDYTLGTNVVAFPPGSSNVFLFLNPIDDAAVEGTETVVLTVIRPPPNAFSLPYNVGLPSNATVFIFDNDTNVPPPPPTNATLIAAGSVWKYLDNGSDQGTAWRALVFDDTSWASGPAQLGYGDGDEVTVVNGGPMQNHFITTYFRRTFSVADASAITDLTVRLLRDDGGVVYLNGMEVFRSNMSNGPIHYLTLAMLAAGGADETSNFYSAPINASLLVNGQNVIAVEIHQNSPLSSDISFDLELIANGGPQPPERTIVSVVALDPSASESGVLTVIDDGSFAVRRTGNLHADIPVFIRLTGSAQNGVDYAFISNRVVIPAGSTQTVVRVVPLNDGLAEGTEAVGLTIDPVACPAIFPPPPECYEVGSPQTATVFIADGPGGGGTNFPIVRVFATISNATEEPLFVIPLDTGTGIVVTNWPPGVPTPMNVGRFTFTRTGPLSNSLPVFFALSGTAGNGVDYTLISNLVVFPPGASNAHVIVSPIDDSEVEETETVVLTVPPPPPVGVPPYNVGSPQTATVFIHDNDRPTEPVPLIAAGSVWKYLDNGTDQGTAWRGPSFDDASWAAGLAQLGYGDGDEATVVSGGPDPLIKYVTTYFRRSFNVSNPASFSDLTVRLLRDDGGVVYLNGVEVFRSNMPTGAVNYLTLALAAVGGEDETSNFYSAPIDPSLLVNGQNVVAVEIHQVNPTSTDISFDLELIGTGGPQPPERTVISVVATDSQASEPVPALPAINSGQFAIRRTGNLNVGIPVSFVLGGSASNGSDYTFISNHVVIPAGSTQAFVNVVPLMDNIVEGTETVILTLLSPVCIAIDPPPPQCYLVGSPNQATVFITEGSSGTNRPPVANWNAPPDHTEYPQGMNILLRASASDPDGTISRVEFRRGTALIGITTTPVPQIYALMWSNPPVGSHLLTAVAVDNLGARGTSVPVSITVLGPSTNVPPTNSTFTLAFNNRDGTEGVFFRQYTLDGPVNGGKLLPAMRVVPEDSGQWYYGAEQHAVWRVNLGSGQVQFMQIPSGLPELSWPIGSAFDSIRNRVLVGTLGGEGHLYAYAPTSSQWSLVNDLDNHDLDSIVHHPPDDSIYGFEGGYGGTPQLRKFDAGGNLVSSIPLPQVPTGITGHTSASELVSVGQYLVLLIEPNANWPGQAGGESRIYLIDPRNGEVRLTYSRSLPADSDSDGVPDAEDQCPNTPLHALVDQHGCSVSQPDSDGDGVTDDRDQCPDTSVGAPVDEQGCSAAQRDSDGDGIVDGRDQCPGTPFGVPVDADGCPLRSTNCPPRIAWERSFGGSGYEYISQAQQTADGGYVLGGSSLSGAGGNKTNVSFGKYDIWIVRLDAQGNKLWERSFGGSGDDGLSSIALTADGGFIVGGLSDSGPGGNKTSLNYGTFDLWLLRLDGQGNKLWEKSFGGSRWDVGGTTVLTADGGFIVAGSSESPADGNKTSPNLGRTGTSDLWVLRLNASGEKLWERTFGGGEQDSGAAVQQTADGGFVLAGQTSSGTGGHYKGWVVRLDAGGNQLWDRTYGGTAQEGFGTLGKTADGGFVLGGWTTSGPGGNKTSPNFGGLDSWIVRVDASGVLLWEQTFGGIDEERLITLRLTPDGGIVFGSSSQSPLSGNKTTVHLGQRDWWIVRLAADGSEVWQRNVGGSGDDEFRDVLPMADGGYLLAGNSDSTDGDKHSPDFGGYGDFWVVKLLPEGECDRDSDGDGVPDNQDRCANTPRGVAVNEHGCGIVQIAPCDGPWRNHGDYINAVRDAASAFYKSGLITRAERLEIVHLAAKSDCGRGPRLRLPSQRADEIRTNGCRLILEGDGPATCIIESSPDLIRWTPISTNTLSGVTIEVLDPGACTAPRRFYRMRLE